MKKRKKLKNLKAIKKKYNKNNLILNSKEKLLVKI
jgi:hypothetical protein